MDKLFSEAQDVKAQLEVKLKKDVSLGAKLDDLNKSILLLGNFVGDIRNSIAASSFLQPSDATKDKVTEAEKMKDLCVAHQHGMKQKLRVLKVLL